MVKHSHKPPSRVRYEQAHPTVSARLSREICDRLKKHLAKRGVSFATFVKESLGEQQLKLPDVDKIKVAAWKDGYAKAEKTFKIWHFCANCRKAIVIRPNTDAHKAVIEHMEGWRHTECP